MPVRAHLAKIHRLGDVVIGQQLRHAAGEIRDFQARQRGEHLLHVGRVRLLHRLHPEIEPDVVRFHRIVRGPFWFLDVGMPLVDERLVGGRVDALEVVPGRQMADENGVPWHRTTGGPEPVRSQATWRPRQTKVVTPRSYGSVVETRPRWGSWSR